MTTTRDHLDDDDDEGTKTAGVGRCLFLGGGGTKGYEDVTGVGGSWGGVEHLT